MNSKFFLSLGKAKQTQVEAILAFDMAQERRYLTNRYNISPDRAEQLEKEFKRYLVLCAIYGDSFPISKPVDELWHVALLDPVKYARLEQTADRRFIHRMTMSEDEDVALLPLYRERTLPRYEIVFGEKPDQEFWPPNHCVCLCCDCVEAAA